MYLTTPSVNCNEKCVATYTFHVYNFYSQFCNNVSCFEPYDIFPFILRLPYV